MRYCFILYLLSSFLPIVSIEGYAAETIEQREPGKTSYSQSLTITPAIYPYLVEPKDYPEYYRRPYPSLSWEDFGNKTQFVVGRNTPIDSTEIAEVKGDVYRSWLSLMWDKDFTRRLQFMSKNNLFVHNIGGYGPGSAMPVDGGFGEYIVPKWQIDQIQRYIGNKFTGFDVGEQDGRFNFTYRHIIEPYIPDKKQQYLASQPYFDRVASDLGNWCSALSVLWYWHPILKEGYTMLAGSETQNKITNGQVQYMHLRGAGKQYGILWYGDVSVFDSWGCKIYDDKNGFKNGGSLSLMKRSYYTQYMYNSTILSMEHGWCEGAWATNRGKLSPIGIMHNDCVDFVHKYGQPGVMVTQIALLNDFYSGWMPASHIAASFRVWNGMPYSSGDYLTDALVSMFYPHYERSGFFYDETGAMCATPYGENVDALLSDARVETMKQYPVMVAAGDLFSGGRELTDKINDYVLQGGTFVVTAKNAARFWPEWKIIEKNTLFPAGTKVKVGNEQIVEQAAFRLYKADLPENAQIMAKVGKFPAAWCIPVGKGRVILSLTEFGLNSQPYQVQPPSSWHRGEFNTYLERPYRLLSHFETILDELFSSVNLFSVGKDLGYIVNYLGKGKYRLAVYNNTLKSLPFKIESHIGDIETINELSTGNKLFSCAGYWPHEMKGEVEGKDDESHIYGGDIRLFDVTVKNEKINVMRKINQVSPVTGSYLATDNMMYLKEVIRTMPTFFDYFDGVAVDGKSVLQMDDKALARQNEWYTLQSLDIAADLRSGFDSGYWTFDIQKSAFQRTKDDLNRISKKLQLLYGKHSLLIPCAYKNQCPDEMRAYYNICFIDSISENSNWSYGKNFRLLDCSTLEWDDVYMAMRERCVNKQLDVTVDKKVLPVNENHILALERYEKDIRKAVSEVDCFFDAFGGVCVTAEYIANKSLDALLEEKKWWDKIGLSVIVSFIEEINHFPGLTLCDAVPVYYERSMDYYKDVLSKMGHLGLKRALFTTQAPIEANYSEQRIYNKMKESFKILSEYAGQRQIKILLTNTRFRIAADVKQQKQMLQQIGVSANMGLAVNLNHLSEQEYSQSIDDAGHLLDVVILGGVGSMEHSEYLPIAESGKSADKLNRLKDVLLIEKVWPFTNESIYKDCQYMNWVK